MADPLVIAATIENMVAGVQGDERFDLLRRLEELSHGWVAELDELEGDGDEGDEYLLNEAGDESGVEFDDDFEEDDGDEPLF